MDINYALFDDGYIELWNQGIRAIPVDKVFDRIDFERIDGVFQNPFYKAFLDQIENAEYLGNGMFFSRTFKRKFPYVHLSKGSKVIGLLLSEDPCLQVDYIPLASVGPDMVEWFYTLVSEKAKKIKLNILLNNLQVSVNSKLNVSGVFVNTALAGYHVKTPMDIAACYAGLSDHVESGDSLDECIEFWTEHFKKDSVPPDNFEITYRRSGQVAKRVVV